MSLLRDYPRHQGPQLGWRRVATFLCALLGAFAPLAAWAQTPPAALPDARPMVRRIDAALRQPARLQLLSLSLEELAQLLSERERIPVYIDRHELKEHSFDLQALRFAGEFDDVPLGEALQQLLAEAKLGANIHHEALWLTTAALSKGLVYPRVYLVEDLLPVSREDIERFLSEDGRLLQPQERAEITAYLHGDPAQPLPKALDSCRDFQGLLAKFRAELDPSAWKLQSGEWTACPFAQPCALVLSLSWTGHWKAEKYFADLRARNGGSPMPAQFELPAGEQGATQSPWPDVVIPTTDTRGGSVAEALVRPAALSFQHTTLEEVAQRVAESHGVPVSIDDCAPNAPLLNLPASPAFEEISLDAALTLLLREAQISFYIDDGALIFADRDEAEARCYPCVYDCDAFRIGPLITEFVFQRGPQHKRSLVWRMGQSPNVPPENLGLLRIASHDTQTDMLTSVFMRDEWDYCGGSGIALDFRSGCALVVSQRYEVHREIERVLQELAAYEQQIALEQRRTTEVQAQSLPALRVDRSPALERIEAALATSVDYEFVNASLAEVLAHFERQIGLNIRVDTQIVQEEADLLEQPSITLRGHGVPLSAALRSILGHSELLFCIRDEQLLVADAYFWKEADGYYVRTYDVGELVDAWVAESKAQPSVDPDDRPRVSFRYDIRRGSLPETTPAGAAAALVDLLTAVVRPDAWDVYGGKGVLDYSPAEGLLVVTQSYEVHQELEQLLNDMLAAVRAKQAREAAARARP